MKLAVGEIDLHSGDDRPVITGSNEDTTRAMRRESVGRLVDRLPDLPGWLYLTAAVSSVWGAGWLIFAAGGTGVIYLLIPSPGLVFLAVIFIRKATGWGQRQGRTPQMQLALDIVVHLSSRDERATLEELMAECDQPKEEVVRALRVGVDEDTIDEDLDVESGHWTYGSGDGGEADAALKRALYVDETRSFLGDSSPPSHPSRRPP